MRRGAGISGLQKQQRQSHQLKRVGAELHAQNTEELRAHLDSLRERIEAFALEHRDKINRDPHFRAHFNEMCAAIGVDPLKSSKGFWAQMLGVGDFYYELAVQVADVCIGARGQAGGLISVSELRERVVRRRGRADRPVSRDDVLRAVAQLRQLGGGYAVVTLAGHEYIRSVPRELDADHAAVLAAASEGGAHVSRSGLVAQCSWTAARAQRALDVLMHEGIVWVDEQAEGEAEYWVPCLWQRRQAADAAGEGSAAA
jgi:ESCRT-II complex subunit VPS22